VSVTRHRPLVLRGGVVVDGSAAPAVAADVLVIDGTIAAIGRDLAVAGDAAVVDVGGQVVAPGFVDLHSHADLSLLAFPSADSALRQGVTTIATGNCGGGAAPLAPGAPVGPLAFGYDPAWGIDVTWSTFGEYTSRLDGAGVNVAPLVPHGTIRDLVMGLDPRAATPDEVALMVERLEAALDDGAFGMSTGLEYQPGTSAELAELHALADAVGRRGRVYATHMRDRAAGHGRATLEAIQTVTHTGARLQLSHFASRPNATDAARDEAFERVNAAADAGIPIGVDTFPEVWGPALLIDLVPPWAIDGDPDTVLAGLGNSETRRAIDAELRDNPRFLTRIAGYAEIYVTSTPSGEIPAGTSITTLARERGTSVVDTVLDVLREAGPEYRSVAIRHVYATERDLERLLALPCCSIASDGVVTSGEGAACAMHWSASTYGYAARTIEHFVVNRRFFALEEAVRRLTALPADQLGLADRGRLLVGHRADVAVFEPALVHDLSTPDDMARHPTGITHVLVNGHFAVRDGALTDDRHGRLLTP
jgi:N-acyl-D-aspartate/D-glutamate deacylase